MIVQCGSCKTRFRVPDEKIGDKPVKVRCSKCSNVFPVTRADGQAEGTAGSAATYIPQLASSARSALCVRLQLSFNFDRAVFKLN